MALALGAWLDVRSVRPGKAAKLFLAVEVSSRPDGAPVEARPPATTVLVLDVSGSMAGEPLDQVVRSVDMMLDGLRPSDRVGVVAFSDEATEVAPPTLADAAGKRLVRARVARLVAEGNTNVEAGLIHAARLLDACAGPSGVVLLSDGVPNRGACTIPELREVAVRHRHRGPIAALGYGAAHAEEALLAIGEAGGGGYAFVPEPSACVRAFARAVGAQADVVAARVELVVEPGEGVEVVGFVGREQARFTREGIVLLLPDMVPGASRIVALELSVDAHPEPRLLRDVARASLRWTRAATGIPEATSVDVSVEIAERAAEIDGDGARRVMLARADRVREDARALADRGNFGAAAAAIRQTLADVERIPGFHVGEDSPLGDAFELLVDEAQAYERKPSPESYAVFRKVAIASRAGAPPPPKSSRGPASSRMLDHVAGAPPAAFLVVRTGHDAGRRHRLKDECVIGRTASADVAVASASVSRRHAEVYALEGEYWACDLGSTNPTFLNGEALGTRAEKLRHGDVLRLGDVELVYEEDAPRP